MISDLTEKQPVNITNISVKKSTLTVSVMGNILAQQYISNISYISHRINIKSQNQSYSSVAEILYRLQEKLSWFCCHRISELVGPSSHNHISACSLSAAPSEK